MTKYSVPYGKKKLEFELPEDIRVNLLTPPVTKGTPDPGTATSEALENPHGDVNLREFQGAKTAAIAINDKTRPVPHQYLLPPLLRILENLGISNENIQLIIATGAHSPMTEDEFFMVVPRKILARYPVVSHDCDDQANLVFLGQTSRQTPVWINKGYLSTDIRLVVGNIEPHQFQGFSGGVKSAAIGLAGRETINHNHAMMMSPEARLGAYETNPARQDVEEIGQLIEVHFALNAIMNDRKEIVHVLAGEPAEVMKMGIPLARRVVQVPSAGLYDLLIASPGGHPKDINLYQAQKGLAHASQVTRNDGWIILVAACPEGTGSQKYERWVQQVDSHQDLFQRFQAEGFQVGPHKAFQIARDADRVNVLLVSEMEPAFVRGLLLEPAPSLDAAILSALQHLPRNPRVGIMPWANATIPLLNQNP